jgi:hypothetical protein
MYAADKGAKVINLSLGGPYSRTIEYAMQYAHKKGAVIVAASGNDGMEEVSTLHLPNTSKGSFTLKIKKQKAGTIISVTAKDKAGNISKEAGIKVLDKTPPSSPQVNKVTSKSKTIKGKTETNATVSVKVKNKVIGTARANKKGSFTVKIKQQKKGTVMYVTSKDSSGNVSNAKKVKVH